jgi:hypothetical protein
MNKWTRRKYRDYDSGFPPLSERFQLAENLRASQLITPALTMIIIFVTVAVAVLAGREKGDELTVGTPHKACLTCFSNANAKKICRKCLAKSFFDDKETLTVFKIRYFDLCW